MHYPPLSLAVTRWPERQIYAGSLSLVAVLFVGMALPIRNFLTVNPTDGPARLEPALAPKAASAVNAAFIAFLGMWGQAAIPLPSNMVPDIPGLDNGEESESDARQAAVHQLAALVFFGASMYHSFNFLGVLGESTTCPLGWKAGGQAARASWCVKAICTGLTMLPMLPR